PASLGGVTRNPGGEFPGIADRNAFGLKPSAAPASAEPPATPGLAKIELPKEVSEKPIGFGPSAGGGGAERSAMARRYGLARGTDTPTAWGGSETPALKSGISDLSSAPAVAATTPAPAAAGDYFAT